MKGVAEARGAVMLQPDRILSERSIPRRRFFSDDVHMTVEGLDLFARTMAKEMIDAGVIERAVRRRELAAPAGTAE